MHAYLSEAEIYNDYSIPPLIQTLKEIRQEFSQQVFLNALEEGEIVGSVRAYLEKGHRSARNLYLYRKLGYREFKRVPANDWIVLVFLEKNRNHDNL